MRERWARGLALATGAMVLIVAAAFALILNPDRGRPTADAAQEPTVDSGEAPEQVSRGQEVFARNHCAGCHSVAGKGSPRSRLDGVGSRRTRDELHDWVVADESVRAELSPRAVAAKRDYAQLPAADMEALLAYLASLREQDAGHQPD